MLDKDLNDSQNPASGAPSVTPTEPANSESAPTSDEFDIDLSDPGLLGDFVTECREHIEGAEAALLALETNEEDMEAVDTVFRAFHSIKGTSASLGLAGMSELAHSSESFLIPVREKEIQLTGGYADLALRAVDMLKRLTQSLQNALGGEAMVKPDGYDDLMRLLADPEAAGISGTSDDRNALPRLGDILVHQAKIDREQVEAVVANQGDEPVGLALLRSQTASVTDVAKALRAQRRMSQPPKPGTEHAVESSVRVRTDYLDRLIDMIGEMVIAHSMVSQDRTVVLGGRHDLAKKVAHAGEIVRELQDLSMSMRMVPIKAAFGKTTRLVRDLARKSSKMVNLITEGEDTEIDRRMVEGLNDPLVHMIRNAVDHGIEPPEERERLGKPAVATVRLAAHHSSGNVLIEVQDDGRGLARDKIIEKALSKGLIESDKGMSDDEVSNLIFEPGFSTAKKLTDVSGRGVGMDVVKRGIEALRGRVDVSSRPNEGCTFTMNLPLTLAIIDGMLVKVGDHRYIVPTVNIRLSLRPTPDILPTIAGRGEIVMLRGKPIPMIRLHRMFNIQRAVEDPTEGLVVVVGDGKRQYALLVDELLGQRQVVAKSLGDGIGKVRGISGGAILGDGRVGLILDPSEIADLARQVSDGTDHSVAVLH